MPVVIPPGSFMLSLEHSGPSTTGSVPTWTLGVTGDPNGAGGDSFLEWLESRYSVGLSSLYTVTKVKLTTADGSIVIPTSMEGAHGSTPEQPATSLLVRKRTASFGRANQGRMYIPGYCFTDEIADDGRINLTPHGAIQGIFDDLNTALTDGDWVPVILHSASSDPTAIGAFEVERLVATQRRRLRT